MASPQTKKTIKIFIDSSVLIAAAISPNGSARDLILASFRNEFKIFISGLVLEETKRNLFNKAPKALPSLQYFLETLNPEVIIPAKSIILKVAKIVEVKDAPIVAGAISAGADYLVSYDRQHLLAYKQEIEAHFKVKTVTPDELTQKPLD